MEATVIVVSSLFSFSKSVCGELGMNHCYLFSQVEEVRDAMENEMRTQLRRQAAAHTDHLRDVLRVQEQELKHEFEQVRTCCKALTPLQPVFFLFPLMRILLSF